MAFGRVIPRLTCGGSAARRGGYLGLVSLLRSPRVVSLLVAASLPVLAAGCGGESDIEKRAREANDAVTTPQVELDKKAQEKLAAENEKLARQDEDDRKGLAKDVRDALDGSAEQAQKYADERKRDAEKAAKEAADGVIEDAQDEAERIRNEAQKAIDEALEDATSP